MRPPRPSRPIARAWELDLPHDEKVVLLALAWYADDDGGNVRPGTATVGKRIGYSERMVRKVISKLERKQLVERMGRHPHIDVSGRPCGYTTIYRVNIPESAPTCTDSKSAQVCSDSQAASPVSRNSEPVSRHCEPVSRNSATSSRHKLVPENVLIMKEHEKNSAPATVENLTEAEQGVFIEAEPLSEIMLFRMVLLELGKTGKGPVAILRGTKEERNAELA